MDNQLFIHPSFILTVNVTAAISNFRDTFYYLKDNFTALACFIDGGTLNTDVKHLPYLDIQSRLYDEIIMFTLLLLSSKFVCALTSHSES
jgi:hypothetical protein